jgi:cytochrome c biogenesis protein CcdA/thiol-disulfide isomerase/thioredoxin
MQLLLLSFVAGLLTVLAPCILPLLPIIVGGTVSKKSRTRPLIIAASLASSIIIFTLLLKASTLFIQIPPITWRLISGGIIIAFGLISIFPDAWDKLAIRWNLGTASQRLLAKAGKHDGILEPILIGAALGPVFSSCSPTYAIILATVLPARFGLGLIYLVAYALGLAVVLLGLGYAGQAIIGKLNWLADPHGWFKRGLGILFVLVGVLIISGTDKRLETYLLDHNLVPAINIEEQLLPKRESGVTPTKIVTTNTNAEGAQFALNTPVAAPELVGIQGWINSNGESLASLRGKVVLIDFWTYSCINCIHTLPHVEGLYEKYKDQGLVVLGIHAPEFSFEKVRSNVEQAVKDDHLTYPVGLDNNLSTWDAFHNQYWPAEYFIDRNGMIRHYHFGEGGEENNERVIRALLAEGGSEPTGSVSAERRPQPDPGQSPETYLGYGRGMFFASPGGLKPDTSVNYSLPTTLDNNYWALGGDWRAGSQDTVSGAGAILRYKFTATDVYLVMGADAPQGVKVLVNGKPVAESGLAGSDVGQDSRANVQSHRLYRLVHANQILRDAILELQFPPGVSINAFTFDS